MSQVFWDEIDRARNIETIVPSSGVSSHWTLGMLELSDDELNAEMPSVGVGACLPKTSRTRINRYCFAVQFHTST